MRGIAKSLGEASLSVCALHSTFDLNTEVVEESGYLYSPKWELAFILVKNKLVSIEIQGETTISLSVWNTRKGECVSENFDPVR